jgi:hypothetical protein
MACLNLRLLRTSVRSSGLSSTRTHLSARVALLISSSHFFQFFSPARGLFTISTARSTACAGVGPRAALRSASCSTARSRLACFWHSQWPTRVLRLLVFSICLRRATACDLRPSGCAACTVSHSHRAFAPAVHLRDAPLAGLSSCRLCICVHHVRGLVVWSSAMTYYCSRLGARFGGAS